MKKVSIIIIALVLCFALSACSSQTESEPAQTVAAEEPIYYSWTYTDWSKADDSAKKECALFVAKEFDKTGMGSAELEDYSKKLMETIEAGLMSDQNKTVKQLLEYAKLKTE